MNQPTIPVLPEDLMDKWIAALESGEYQQTNGFLHVVRADINHPVGFCCLGVLCDIVNAPTVARDGSASVYYYDPATNYPSTTYLPSYLKQWLDGYGIDDTRLAHMNDGGTIGGEDDEPVTYQPHTFPQIADYLRNVVAPKPITDLTDTAQ